MMEGQFNKRIEVASKILQRLDANEPLSIALSQIKLLAELCNDGFMSARIDLAIHGLTRLPEREKRVNDPIFKQALFSHCDLCSTQDPRTITLDSVFERAWQDIVPERNWIIIQSVFELESIKLPINPWPGISDGDAEQLLRLSANYSDSKLLLTRMRSYFYEYTSKELIKAQKERDNFLLLGPDYNLVLSCLSTLDTVVGQELEASLNRLHSSNAADWALCVLGCRNVVIKLGTLLWLVRVDLYSSKLSDKVFTLVGDKEKNKLSAYIDYHWQRAKGHNKEMLKEAFELVPKIWDIGSKGKTNRVRFKEAQDLVIDTFQLVDLLEKNTSLVPLSHLDAT